MKAAQNLFPPTQDKSFTKKCRGSLLTKKSLNNACIQAVLSYFLNVEVMGRSPISRLRKVESKLASKEQTKNAPQSLKKS